MIKLKYSYSRLSSESILQLLIQHYELSNPVTCQYYVFGLHDNYLIESDNKKYIFRIYRNDWRTEQQVKFELELLNYLGNVSANVATPIQNKSSELSFEITTPEGNRIAALFNYAKGNAVENITIEQSTLLGVSVAKLHELSNQFKTDYKRPILDMDYLVDRSLGIIKPFISNEQMIYLRSIQTSLNKNTVSLNKTSTDYGICIGDVNLSNFHITDKNCITHFDFDQCGYGYRVFDIAKFYSTLHSYDSKSEIKTAFIQGYQQIRILTELEYSKIAYLEIASIIWVLSIHVSNVNKIGYQYLEKPFWDKRMKLIERLFNAIN